MMVWMPPHDAQSDGFLGKKRLVLKFCIENHEF